MRLIRNPFDWLRMHVGGGWPQARHPTGSRRESIISKAREGSSGFRIISPEGLLNDQTTIDNELMTGDE